MADIIITEEQVVRLRNFLLSENADLRALTEWSNKLNENKAVSKNPASVSSKIDELRKMIPEIRLTEKMGVSDSEASQIVKQYAKTLGGGNFKQNLKRLSDFLNNTASSHVMDKSGQSKMGWYLSAMVLVEALFTIVKDYSPSGSGFLFESFLTSLFKNNAVQVTGKNDKGQLGIEDIMVTQIDATEGGGSDKEEKIYKEDTYYSLKLMKGGSAVKGSLKNLLRFFVTNPAESLSYIYAEKLDGGKGKLRISEFVVTKNNLQNFFIDKESKRGAYMIKSRGMPFRANTFDDFLNKMEEYADNATTRNPINVQVDSFKISGEYFNKTYSNIFKKILNTTKKSMSIKQFITQLKKLEKQFIKIDDLFNNYDSVNDEKLSEYVSPLDGDFEVNIYINKQESIKIDDLSLNDIDSIVLSKNQFSFSESMTKEFFNWVEITTLDITDENISKIMTTYATDLLNVIAPIYAAIDEFEYSLRNYFHGQVGKSEQVGRAQKAIGALDIAVRDAGLIQTKTSELSKLNK